jgi:SAM-dependent methyltransferase
VKIAEFANCYADAQRADAYAKLGFARTYYLAYRDLPEIFQEHVRGRLAVDFGCGTGRSTRLLRNYGFQVIGVDISREMIHKAREIDPEGDYRLVEEADFSGLGEGAYDLVLSMFTFDNVPAAEKVPLFSQLRGLLKATGRMVNVVSSPNIYLHEWASFSTRAFPENRLAGSGDMVRIIVTEHDDARPVEDILCTDESYRRIFDAAGFGLLDTIKPLAIGFEPYAWVNETQIAPWVIYVLKPIP